MSAIDRDLTLALAKAQANLDLIASRSDVLSDLGDLKEVKRLDSECALLIRDHAKSGRVPPDPLAALESEVVALIAWGEEVQALLDEGMELLDPDRLVAEDHTADKIGRAKAPDLANNMNKLKEASEKSKKASKKPRSFSGNEEEFRAMLKARGLGDDAVEIATRSKFAKVQG